MALPVYGRRSVPPVRRGLLPPPVRGGDAHELPYILGAVPVLYGDHRYHWPLFGHKKEVTAPVPTARRLLQ